MWWMCYKPSAQPATRLNHTYYPPHGAPELNQSTHSPTYPLTHTTTQPPHPPLPLPLPSHAAEDVDLKLVHPSVGSLLAWRYCQLLTALPRRATGGWGGVMGTQVI